MSSSLPAAAAPALVRIDFEALNGCMASLGDQSAEDRRVTHKQLMVAISEKRDREAFIRLFEDFAPRVKAYLMRLGADAETAGDIAQDVMLTVWRQARLFDAAKASVSTWIFTIARNRRIDLLRRERRPGIDPNDPALVRNEDRDAHAEVLATQEGVRIRKALAELPDEQADLLRLAYFEDKSHSAIASEVDLPLGTVKSRLRLAIGKLRVALKDMQ